MKQFSMRVVAHDSSHESDKLFALNPPYVHAEFFRLGWLHFIENTLFDTNVYSDKGHDPKPCFSGMNFSGLAL